mmetsp:Transcript_26770/g.63497  ORF Transcript_26770/g.63497 Transcript_26770/m.63497 type:complete len:211 (+) Transcript_26770:503-1135(+)
MANAVRMGGDKGPSDSRHNGPARYPRRRVLLCQHRAQRVLHRPPRLCRLPDRNNGDAVPSDGRLAVVCCLQRVELFGPRLRHDRRLGAARGDAVEGRRRVPRARDPGGHHARAGGLLLRHHHSPRGAPRDRRRRRVHHPQRGPRVCLPRVPVWPRGRGVDAGGEPSRERRPQDGACHELPHHRHQRPFHGRRVCRALAAPRQSRHVVRLG